MNETNTALRDPSSKAIQSKAEHNTELKSSATNNIQNASVSDKKADEVSSKMEQFNEINLAMRPVL